MDSNYHIFKKSVQSKGKTVHKWYCYWNDPVTGVMHQKVCKGCKTQAEAYAFVSALPPLFVEEKVTIGKIGKWMYIPGSSRRSICRSSIHGLALHSYSTVSKIPP